MYRIGEFSILNQVTIKTLRYYDQIGLFKPKVVDKFTGYRYYSDEQQEEFNHIIEYKNLGFSLDEIKKMNESKDKNEQIIREKINQLTHEINENRSKISILSNKLRGNIMKIELKPYNEKYKIGKRITLKNRNCESEFKKLKEEIAELNLNITLGRPVLCNFELGYEIENIDVFIGWEIKEYNFDLPLKIGNLEIMGLSKSEKKLVGKCSKKEIHTLYSDIIKYAHENNIQIRDFFKEVYNENEVEIYVEAFDLNEENEDYIQHLKNYTITTEISEDLVGEYQIREILPSVKWMFNPDKQKSMLDTKFNKLKLNLDGTTNFDNIKWNKKELVINYNGQNIPEPLHRYEHNGEIYIEILMNETYEHHQSQRPMFYLYKKIK